MKNVFTKSPLRRTALGGAVALGATALLITNLPAHAESTDNARPLAECEVEEILSDDDNPSSIGHTMDPTGDWVGGRIYPARTIRLWNDGELVDLDIPGTDDEILGLNSSGSGVGFSYRGADDTTVPYAYVDGDVVHMSVADDESEGGAWARSINEDGVIAGVSVTREIDPVNPLRWESYDAEPEVLPLPEDATGGDVRHIAEDGTMVGFYMDANEDRVPYTWDADGNGQELPGMDDSSPVTGTANDINGDWIVGPDEANNVPLVWGPDSEYATEITELDKVQGVSANGDFVGEANGSPTFVTAEGDVVALPGPDGAEVSGSANAVNDDATVITGTLKDGDNQAALWRCS